MKLEQNFLSRASPHVSPKMKGSDPGKENLMDRHPLPAGMSASARPSVGPQNAAEATAFLLGLLAWQRARRPSFNRFILEPQPDLCMRAAGC